MAWMKGAIHKNISPGSNDPPIEVVGIIYHVAVSESESLFPYFNGPSGGIESHFYIRRDGTIEQYRNTGYEADANYKANSFYQDGRRKGYLSVETQGMGRGKWTAQQIESLVRLTLWASDVHGFPLRKATGPYSGGIGFHAQFLGVWTPYTKRCPGYDRIPQIDDEIMPALRRGKVVDDMPNPSDLWNHRINEYDRSSKAEDRPARVILAQAHNRAGDARKAATAANRAAVRAERAVQALAKALGPEVEAAVVAALAEAVVDVEVTVKDGEV